MKPAGFFPAGIIPSDSLIKMDLKTLITEYNRSQNYLKALMEAKHQSLEQYALKEGAKQGYLDRGNAEIDAAFTHMDAARKLIGALDEILADFAVKERRLMNADSTIRRLRTEIEKAEIYIRSKGLDPHLWRWVRPEYDRDL